MPEYREYKLAGAAYRRARRTGRPILARFLAGTEGVYLIRPDGHATPFHDQSIGRERRRLVGVR